MDSTRTGIQLYFFSAVLLLLCACNPVKYVAINNHREEPQQVRVYFDQHSEILYDNDSLSMGPIGQKDFDSAIIRTNIDSGSYRFTAPPNAHIELMPEGVGLVITRVVIKNGTDSLTVNLGDKKQLKKLKKDGTVDTYGRFSDLFFINRK